MRRSTSILTAMALAAPLVGWPAQQASAAPAAPRLAALSHRTDATTGGLHLVLTGDGFTAGARVRFGGATAPTTRLDAHHLQVVVPAHAAGSVAVQVVQAGATSAAGPATTFRYVAADGTTSRATKLAATTGIRVRAAATVARITDAGLRSCVDDALALPQTATPTAAQLARLTTLACQDRSITSLQGLQAATGITELDLSRNRIADLSPVSRLPRLRKLWAANNQASTIPTLPSGMLQIDVRGNRVTSLEPLRRLTHLTDVAVDDNLVTSLAPLSGHTALKGLEADFNQVSDLRPLATDRALVELRLWSNRVASLAPLAGLTRLQLLDVAQNQVGSANGLSGLRALTMLNLSDNHIADLTALKPLVGLRSLDLDDNQVVSVAPLAGMTHLDWLFLRANHVKDLSPLRAVPAQAIEAEGQTFSLPVAPTTRWPMVLRDRNGQTPLVSGAVIAQGTVRWPGTGSRTATWHTGDGTFTGTLKQVVRPAR